jgi:hypothetical protein
MPDPFPVADVAVVLITDAKGEKLLVDYNPHWDCFTFPMVKVDDPPEAARAAVRAAAEVLGRPLPPTGLPVPLEFDVPVYQTSGRDGVMKRYRYRPFALRVTAAPQPLPGHIAIWLTPAELETHEPVSPTVRHVLGAVPFVETRRAVGL